MQPASWWSSFHRPMPSENPLSETARQILNVTPTAGPAERKWKRHSLTQTKIAIAWEKCRNWFRTYSAKLSHSPTIRGARTTCTQQASRCRFILFACWIAFDTHGTIIQKTGFWKLFSKIFRGENPGLPLKKAINHLDPPTAQPSCSANTPLLKPRQSCPFRSFGGPLVPQQVQTPGAATGNWAVKECRV